MKTTIVCPFNLLYSVVFDSSEVFPNDPGNGTPEMVYGPHQSSGTLTCVQNEGELSCGPRVVVVPRVIASWLDGQQVEEAQEAFWSRVNGDQS